MKQVISLGSPVFTYYIATVKPDSDREGLITQVLMQWQNQFVLGPIVVSYILSFIPSWSIPLHYPFAQFWSLFTLALIWAFVLISRLVVNRISFLVLKEQEVNELHLCHLPNELSVAA